MLKILFYSSMKEIEVVTGLKENLKNRDIYNSVILKKNMDMETKLVSLSVGVKHQDRTESASFSDTYY